MKGAMKCHNLVLAGIEARDLHGRFDGLGSGGEHNRASEVRRRDLYKLLGELRAPLVEEVVRVDGLLCLFLHSTHEARVAVSGVCDEHTAGEVQKRVVVHVGGPDAFSMLPHNRHLFTGSFGLILLRNRHQFLGTWPGNSVLITGPRRRALVFIGLPPVTLVA